MPLPNEHISIIGIVEIGNWSATSVAAGGATDAFHEDNVYTETPWKLTHPEGAKIVPSVSTVKQRSGQSAWAKDSFNTEADAQLQVRMIDGELETERKLSGLPEAALTGDLSATPATAETLGGNGS